MNAVNIYDSTLGSVAAGTRAATSQPVTPAICVSTDQLATSPAVPFAIDRRRVFNAITRDVRYLVKAKPGVTLIAAVILGFMVGRLFSSR